MTSAIGVGDELTIDLGKHWPEFYPKQADWFWWDPGTSDPVTEFIGGSWRSGKSSVGFAKYSRLCLLNGWTEEYGRKRPKSFVTAPTKTVLRDATIPMLLEMVPEDLIFKYRKTEGELHWVNGHITLLRSAEGEFDGFEATHGLSDEVHRATYWTDASKITNYKARLSDKRAVRSSFIAIGLPTSGRVRQTFEHCDNVALLAAADNPNNSKAFVDSLLETCPAGMEDTFIRGRWMTPPGAVFFMWSADRHLVDWAPDMSAPVHVGLDLGNHARVIFLQQRGPVFFVVDEMITWLVGAKDTVAAIKASKWSQLIQPGHSVICIDPTVKRDDYFTIVDAFQYCEVVQFAKGEPGHSIEWGIQQMQVALLNAKNQVRLVVAQELAKNRSGVVDAFETCRRHEILGHIVKDDRTDHSRDALRYLIARLLPEQLPSAQLVSPGR